MKKSIALIIVLVFVQQTYSQRYIYKGEKKYLATNEWQFRLSKQVWASDNVQVSVVKNGIGGYLLLSIEVTADAFFIEGKIFMILESGETITLTQKVVNDHVDGLSKVLYSISPLQYKKLKEVDISTIRFSVGGENHTADNQHTVEYTEDYGPGLKFDKRAEVPSKTAEEIRQLDDIEGKIN